MALVALALVALVLGRSGPFTFATRSGFVSPTFAANDPGPPDDFFKFLKNSTRFSSFWYVSSLLERTGPKGFPVVLLWSWKPPFTALITYFPFPGFGLPFPDGFGFFLNFMAFLVRRHRPDEDLVLVV